MDTWQLHPYACSQPLTIFSTGSVCITYLYELLSWQGVGGNILHRIKLLLISGPGVASSPRPSLHGGTYIRLRRGALITLAKVNVVAWDKTEVPLGHAYESSTIEVLQYNRESSIIQWHSAGLIHTSQLLAYQIIMFLLALHYMLILSNFMSLYTLYFQFP